jgi:ribosomal protein S12 methylthiotransferase accessory factor
MIERMGNGFLWCDAFLADPPKESFVFTHDEIWKDSGSEILLPKDFEFLFSEMDEVQSIHFVDSQSERSKIALLPFIKQKTGETITVPIQFLHSIYASNGMAAGNSFEEASVQALSEICERYARKQILLQPRSLPQISLSQLETFPHIMETISDIEQNGKLILLDASLGKKLPVVCALFCQRDRGKFWTAFGAHPQLDVAIGRTLNELFQGRNNELQQDSSQLSGENKQVADDGNLTSHFINGQGLIPVEILQPSSVPFKNWHMKGNISETKDYLLNIIDGLSFTVYYRQYDKLGFPVCQYVIPGMSEVYSENAFSTGLPTWIKQFRTLFFKLPNLSPVEFSTLADLLDEIGLNDHERAIDLIGLYVSEDSPWNRFCIGELRLLVYLQQKNMDLAYHQLDSVFHFRQDSPLENISLYDCLRVCLECLTNNKPLDQIYPSLVTIFGEKISTQAINMTKGESLFSHLMDDENGIFETQFPLHYRFLEWKNQIFQY